MTSVAAAVSRAIPRAAAAASAAAPTGTALVWYKLTDLRIADHEPLTLAHTRHAAVVNVVVLDPWWFGRTREFGFPKCGHFRAKFLLETVVDLRKVRAKRRRRNVAAEARRSFDSASATLPSSPVAVPGGARVQLDHPHRQHCGGPRGHRRSYGRDRSVRPRGRECMHASATCGLQPPCRLQWGQLHVI